MNSKPLDVIVVGAGIAGLSCAGILDYDTLNHLVDAFREKDRSAH